MRPVLLGLAAALLVSGCGSEPTTGGEPAAREDVELRLRQIYDMSEGAYVEGSNSFVRVEGADGDEFAETRLDEGTRLEKLKVLSTATLRLAPGSYRLVSFQRPCAGDCGALDPPTDECSADLRLDAGRPVEATITVLPGQGCTIELR